MPIPHFEVPTGVVDGVNKTFYTSLPYSPRSTAVFLNGQLKRQDFEDGWVETDPSSGRIDLREAPKISVGPDVVQVFYLDTTTNGDDDSDGTCSIIVTITEEEPLEAVLLDDEGLLYGMVAETEVFPSYVQSEAGVFGIVAEEEAILGSVEVCP